MISLMENACKYTARLPRCHNRNYVDINCPGSFMCAEHIVHANYMIIDSNNIIYSWDTTVPAKNTNYFSLLANSDMLLLYMPHIISGKFKVINFANFCQYKKRNYPYQISSCAQLSQKV